MERSEIRLGNFKADAFDLFNNWLLLVGGSTETGACNPMTISWGFFGVMWFKPVVMVAVRPQRHTLKLIEKYDSFTLCALPETKKEVLNFCGSRSGAECDKIRECGLTPVPGVKVDAPGLDEAELIIECRKLYCDNIKGKNFLNKKIIDDCYPERDYHQLFIAEILRLEGISKFKKQHCPN
ncbi:MAG: flavin reductase family protein [Victivallales bacterium]|nr:flavin reductase family protein [Victivallales bacterium]